MLYKSPVAVNIPTKQMKAAGMLLFEEEYSVTNYPDVLLDQDADNDIIILR